MSGLQWVQKLLGLGAMQGLQGLGPRAWGVSWGVSWGGSCGGLWGLRAK